MAKKKREDLESLTQGLVNDLPLGGAQEPDDVAPEVDAVQPAEAPVATKGDEAQPAEASEAAPEAVPFADAPEPAGEAAETGPGELMVSLPMGAEPEKLETIFLRVPKGTKVALQGIAKRRRMSLNAFLAAVLEDLARKFGDAK